MRILILGSGAREHAIALKLSKEIGKENVFVAPGNGGTHNCSINVDFTFMDFYKVKAFCIQEQIDVVIPGSEEAIDAGIRDFMEADSQVKDVFVFLPINMLVN